MASHFLPDTTKSWLSLHIFRMNVVVDARRMSREIESVVGNLKNLGRQSDPAVNKIIATAGYKTLDEYVKATPARLTPKQHQLYNTAGGV